ncbi:DUF262 domain-containing protein [Salinicoccus roseus]|uniref:GmrSD restriction endonuclease domain-containing protein n=1 Tax=Salinicoccus roseus TaxID=45670 RepID=UPI001CA7B357|nr:DUF262 domain-containing protein [Salinicoccus roseus]MBY8910163.1 DUF262 domain-containing protein [Salinicoccus roseus]
MSNYNVNNSTVNALLGWIDEGIVAIPEIQRPFVWSATKVRDLLDSLYKDYPIGYIITWQNPSIFDSIHTNDAKLSQTNAFTKIQ